MNHGAGTAIPTRNTHLEAESPVAVGVEGVEQEVGVGAGICGRRGMVTPVTPPELGSGVFPDGPPPDPPTGFGDSPLTALREEPRVDERESFLIHEATGTFLERGAAPVTPRKAGTHGFGVSGQRTPPGSRS